MTTNSCCAGECGKEEGGAISLNTCRSRHHVSTQTLGEAKKQCKLRVTELRNEALFKDPPTAKGGLSHLLPTNAEEIDMLCFTFTRNNYSRLY